MDEKKKIERPTPAVQQQQQRQRASNVAQVPTPLASDASNAACDAGFKISGPRSAARPRTQSYCGNVRHEPTRRTSSPSANRARPKAFRGDHTARERTSAQTAAVAEVNCVRPGLVRNTPHGDNLKSTSSKSYEIACTAAPTMTGQRKQQIDGPNAPERSSAKCSLTGCGAHTRTA